MERIQHLEIYFLKTYYWLHPGPATADWICTQHQQTVLATVKRSVFWYLLIQTYSFREEHNPSILRRVQCPRVDTSWWTAHARLSHLLFSWASSVDARYKQKGASVESQRKQFSEPMSNRNSVGWWGWQGRTAFCITALGSQLLAPGFLLTPYDSALPASLYNRIEHSGRMWAVCFSDLPNLGSFPARWGNVLDPL